MQGKWFFDGVDIFLNFSIIIEEGSADLLKFPPKKPSTEYDWNDAHGIDVDLSQIFFSKREVVLSCALLVNDENDFWLKHDGFIGLLTQPGLRRFELSSHGSRSYYVYYQETNNYDQVKALKGIPIPYKIAHRFSLVLVEPEPNVNASNQYIVTEEGKFLIA